MVLHASFLHHRRDSILLFCSVLCVRQALAPVAKHHRRAWILLDRERL
jgi:hypothetical protein